MSKSSDCNENKIEQLSMLNGKESTCEDEQKSFREREITFYDT